jgi:hypothetical protein
LGLQRRSRLQAHEHLNSLARIERQALNQQVATLADDALSALYFHCLSVEDLAAVASGVETSLDTARTSACATSWLQVFVEPLDGQLLGLLVRFEVNPVMRDIRYHHQILRAGEPLVRLERVIPVVE